MRFLRIPTIFLTVLAMVPLAAFAVTHPHTRSGFFIGLGLGVANAGIKDGDSRETGGSGAFRIGFAPREDLVVGMENSAWVKTETVEGVDLTMTFSVHTFGITYYPGNEGLYVKAGLGFASSSWEIASGGFKLSYDDTGFGLLGATGYEFRLTDKFAIGPEVEFAYLNVGGVVESANYVSVKLMLNW